MPTTLQANFLMWQKLANFYFNFSTTNYTYFFYKLQNISLFLNITLDLIRPLTNWKQNVNLLLQTAPVFGTDKTNIKIMVVRNKHKM
jgi:hypothetical protein